MYSCYKVLSNFGNSSSANQLRVKNGVSAFIEVKKSNVPILPDHQENGQHYKGKGKHKVGKKYIYLQHNMFFLKLISNKLSVSIMEELIGLQIRYFLFHQI